MSSIGGTIVGGPDMARAEVEPPRRSYGAQVWHYTVARTGAKLGLAWIGVIAFLAVFAPFLANSHPLLLKMEGRWSSPVLQHLNSADVVMLAAAATAFILWLLRSLPVPTRMMVFLWVVAAVIPLSTWKTIPDQWKYEFGVAGRTLIVIGATVMAIALVVIPIRLKVSLRGKLIALAALLPVGVLLVTIPINPPGTMIAEQYREAKVAGRVERVVNALLPYSPTDRLRDQSRMRWQAPSREHWMGTERNSQDVASRMIHASRIALFIGFIATSIALAIGVTIGGLMGYFSGKIDILGMRLIEIFDSIPTLFLLITFVAFFGRNLYIMMVIIGLTSWVGYARFIRAEFLKLRKQDFVQAAIASGLPLRSILFRHMLPNGIAPVLVSASFGVASAILSESTLSFLGLGLVEEPSWGEMLNQAVGQGAGFQWWMAVFPGLAIFLTVFAYNMVGESLRDAIDPHLRKA